LRLLHQYLGRSRA